MQRNYGADLESGFGDLIKALTTLREEDLEQDPVSLVMTPAGCTRCAAFDVRPPRVTRPSA